ncbi:hypothetical protein ACFL1D_02425 [Candidatus Omnitrophota bacterium]
MLKKKILIAIIITAHILMVTTPPGYAAAPASPQTPHCEDSETPVTNVNDPNPEFSAIFDDPDTGDHADYYQIQVNTASGFTGTMIWDSGKSYNDDQTAEGVRCADITMGTGVVTHAVVQTGQGTDDAGNFMDDTVPTDFSTSREEIRLGEYEGNDIRTGVRFQNVTIPSGATIVTSYITFVSAQSKTTNAVNVDIYGEDNKNPQTYSTEADFYGRIQTTAKVDWDDIEDWDFEEVDSTPSINTILQELVNTYDYSAGAAMAFIFLNDGSDWDCDRKAKTWEYHGDHHDRPELYIEYTAGFIPLENNTTYYWRIKFWDNTNTEGAWSATQQFTTGDRFILDLQVGQSSDDAHEAHNDGTVNLVYSRIIYRSDNDPTWSVWGAHRWDLDSPIPRGAKIVSAYASLYVDASYNDVEGYLHFQLGASPVSFTATDQDITDRGRTTASLNWIESDMSGGWEDTSSLVAPLQEVVSSYSPTALALIFRPDLTMAVDAVFRSTSYDDNATQAAKLHIEYVWPTTRIRGAVIRNAVLR